MRVYLLCMVCLESIFWLRRHHPFQCPLVPRVGGEILEFRSLRSRDLATFDCHYLLYLIILRLISATSASQMHLRSLRSLRKVVPNGPMEGFAFPFYSHFPLLYLAPFHRETTERRPREERLKIATIFDQKSQFFHLFQPSLSISNFVNFSYISCKVSLHFRNAPKIAIYTISVV